MQAIILWMLAEHYDQHCCCSNVWLYIRNVQTLVHILSFLCFILSKNSYKCALHTISLFNIGHIALLPLDIDQILL